MDAIYHERQQGQLCAQHCLNNLLQGPYFNPVGLSEIAHRLDEKEKSHLTDREDISLVEMTKILEQPSSNMDDSGFFSVQVISEALKVWDLELHPLLSARMSHAAENPVDQNAFICNHELHWFAVRKLGRQWFDLDSLKKSPLHITDTYLSLFLAQLRAEGYSIFVVTGILPTSEADQLLSLIPYEPPPPPHSSEGKAARVSKSPQDFDSIEDEDLAEAIALSLVESRFPDDKSK
ncbi:PREDICTED: ataxin-3-like [Amphimedon queenslandica]|uniref:Ataxin-3 homolog n=1 Tax=Amphimedon queenslandica TaxID=400682 RepID=A0A1X7VFQ7_AMPQE|nr:PREDICTED: ataxin-3-like [Amphimedon queenslandica]|eukprot:XP_011410500.1 PREDICTED: ataxin-3-like [Amphimedon queenslandica]